MTTAEQETLLPRLKAVLEAVTQTIARVKGQPLPAAPAPVIESFTVTPPTVAAGQPVTVSFRVRGADMVSIASNPDLPMPSTVMAGDCTLRPDANTSLTLTAHGQGSASMVRSVAVGTVPIPPTPTPTALTGHYTGRTLDRTGQHTDAPDRIPDDSVHVTGLLPQKIARVELHGQPEGEWRYPFTQQYWGVRIERPVLTGPDADLYFSHWRPTTGITIDVIYADGQRQSGTVPLTPHPH